ncbi:hypothetical protein C4R87_19415 [Clostridioides difficile]|nr:hypothetical protein [Clostridioides difficile]
MAIKRIQASVNVVEAAKQRIINIFNNNVPVYMGFSGGKDSLCLAHLVLTLIQENKINPLLLTVQFIDEEAIFPCIEQKTLEWRRKFIMAGAKFDWFCLEVKHYCCFNELTEDESFICWDREKENVWVRRPPKFAIRNHALFKARQETYQAFLHRMSRDGITITGVRARESIQRLQNIARSMTTNKSISSTRQILPIYDWSDKDIWLYLKENKIDIPEIYLYLYQIGTAKNRLRVSQFFSIDTAKVLVKMNEYYPDLMERVIKREPNAYLASLYWDSEMFRRSSSNRKEIEAEENKKDYKSELLIMFNNMNRYFNTKLKRYTAERYKNLFLQVHMVATQDDYKKMYEALIAGDPKLRTYRALHQTIFTRYMQLAKKEEKERKQNG